MTFASLTFLLFFPAVFLLYWLVSGRTRQNVLLILASYVFYGWWDYRFCTLMLASSLLDFAVGLGLGRARRKNARLGLLWCSVLGNLGLLGTFKYYGFFSENLQHLASTFGWQLNYGTREILLPVGISFYTFQTLSYTIDIYRRKIKPTRSLIDYLAFVSFFPQLVAGPIERAANLLPQMTKSRQFDYEQGKDGCRLILWGFVKKLVVADRLAVVVDHVFASPDAWSGAGLFLGAVFFSFQIYCDFSAYSDIAIGTAKLFNIRLMRNFAYPLFSRSLPEFWQRWHISMSTWFRDYVFVALSRRSSRRFRSGSLVVTFLLSGLWHGAAWKFVVWGGINGVLLVGARAFRIGQASSLSDTPGGDRLIPRPVVLTKMLVTFVTLVLIGVFFRAQDVAEGVWIVGTILSPPWSWTALVEAAQGIVAAKSEARNTFLVLGCFVLMEWIHRRHAHPFQLTAWPVALRWSAYSAAIWALFLLMPTTRVNPFIYFQF